MLLADWFNNLGGEFGMEFTQHSASEQAFTMGVPNAFYVTAHFTNDSPFLRFVASDASQQNLVDEIVAKAIDHVNQQDFGGLVWYSTWLNEVDLAFSSFSPMSSFLQRLGNQTRIAGWRRLGANVLLEFVEKIPPDWAESKPILAPKCIVNIHIATPGPGAGHFSSHIAHGVLETVGSICTLALGRPVKLPHAIFPAEAETLADLERRRSDPEILTLARKGVSLDIFSSLSVDGGLDIFRQVRAALITFDAAVRQDRNPVSAILYVVTGECLTKPNTSWRFQRLTKRFIEFFDELMPSDLDQIVAHGNFEEAFGIRRGTRTARTLRRELLKRIYGYRSGQLHEGLEPSYQGLGVSLDASADVRRGLLADFAEAAILRYLVAPRSSLVGHPAAEHEGDMNFEDFFHLNPDTAKTLFGETTFHHLQQALDDFKATLKGKHPVHAIADKDVPLPADGGTTFYKGDGYKLTIVKSLNGIMRGEEYVHGYIYGPVISFESNVMTGNFPNIQHLTFYTGDELRKLLTE